MIGDPKPYPAMKDSGIEWLGEVPEHWQIKRGKKLFKCIDVRSKTGEEELLTVSSNRGVVPRRTANVTMFKAESYSGHKLCWPNDLVINSLWAWAGGLGVSKYHGIISTAYSVYRPRNSVDSRYVHELVRSTPFHWELRVRSKGVWTSRLQLTDDSFLCAPFPLPPLPEQATIAKYLDYVDRRIRRLVRAKRKLIALLTEQKQAIIHRAVTCGLDPGVPLKDSGVEWLGEVPAHWESVRLRRLVKRIDQGVSPQAEAIQADDGWWGVLKSGCVNGGVFKEHEHKRLPSDFKVDESLSVSVGDVLISRACGSPRYVGSAGRIQELKHKLILSDKTFRPVFKEPESVDFIVWAMNSRYFRIQVELTISGAEGLANNLPLSALKRLWVAMPPVEEAVEIAAAIGADIKVVEANIEKVEDEIRLLNEYCTRLISDVVTGKLDVREAAAALPEVDPLTANGEPDDTLDNGVEEEVDEMEAAPEEDGA